ncbi:MAG: hypothetical protein ABF293_10830 [Flavobacteriaceae bacterium]
MNKGLLNFALRLFLVLAFLAGLHWAYLYTVEIAIDPWTIGFCYLVNFIMALAIFYVLLRLAREESQYLGFVFLVGSALKFLIYFLVFDPLFKQDGELTRVEFFLFFVPYFVSLMVETIALVKLLRTES